jgi:hypothetical protein
VPHEIALFWLVLAGFLFVDNLVLVPRGGDFLGFGARGRLDYRPGVRFQLRGRDLVVLNPLNPFDRVALTRRAMGFVSGEQLKAARKKVRDTLPVLNTLSCLGCGYLVVLLALASVSFRVHFGQVLAVLLAVHLAVWVAALLVLTAHRGALQLTRRQALAASLEALFVPGYLVNLGKRVWYRQVLDLPAMALGIRQLRRTRDAAQRELYAFNLATRLDELAGAAEPGPTPSTKEEPPAKAAHASVMARENQGTAKACSSAAAGALSHSDPWVAEARKWIATSAPSDGS